MISWRALGVGSLGWRGRLALRLNIVRPTQFSTQSPPDVLERMEKELHQILRQRGFEVYLLSRLDSLERHVETLNDQMKMQTSYHMEWYQRDLSVLAT